MKLKSIYILTVFAVVFICACFLWMLRNKTFDEKVTYIGYRDKELEKTFGITLEEYVKKKSIIALELNGNEKYDDSVLNRFQLEIQKIIKAEDTNKGIHLKFSNKTTYENVIRSFTICKTEGCRTYIPDGYDFWVFPYYKKTNSKAR